MGGGVMGVHDLPDCPKCVDLRRIAQTRDADASAALDRESAMERQLESLQPLEFHDWRRRAYAEGLELGKREYAQEAAARDAKRGNIIAHAKRLEGLVAVANAKRRAKAAQIQRLKKSNQDALQKVERQRARIKELEHRVAWLEDLTGTLTQK